MYTAPSSDEKYRYIVNVLLHNCKQTNVKKQTNKKYKQKKILKQFYQRNWMKDHQMLINL